MREKLGTKVCDFVYGSLLVGGVPLATYWLLAFLSHWPCDLVFQHYGERPAFRLQMVLLTIAFFAAFPAFVFAVLWRKRHRLLPTWLLAFEIVVGIVWAFFFFAYIALLYGPTDA
jgi:hypothetical protein